MKRIGDWLYALGINTLDQHLSYVTLRGARKRDHPQSFSYHERGGTTTRVRGLLRRLSVALVGGQQVNDVLLLEPTTTAWMYNAVGTSPAELQKLGDSFQRLEIALEHAQVEYDLGARTSRAARVGAGARCAWGAATTGRRAAAHDGEPERRHGGPARAVREGGRNRARLRAAPGRIDGAASDRGAALARLAGWKAVDAAEVPASLLSQARAGFAVTRAPGDRGLLFHHRRRLDDGELLFLVNTSAEFHSAGTIETSARGVEEWDPATGAIRPHSSRRPPRRPCPIRPA